MANSNLAQAKRAQNDEFYTQYPDIEREVNAYLEYDPDTFRGKTILLPCDDPEWSHFTKFFAQRFEVLGLKKLISTSYAYMSNENRQGVPYQPTLFEQGSTLYQEERSPKCGKIYTLTHDHNGDGVLDIDDLEWQYLEGDGDFRSPEVTALRDEADIIITNPPFSLFREFLAWIVEADKKFLIIGNMNAITYKEVFPLIKENKLWLGNGFQNGNAYFRVFDNTKEYAEGVYNDTKDLVKFRNCVWYTNLDHGRRHRPLELMTMEDNLKYNKKLIKKGGYQKYDNYDAIEVPYTDAIPKDYTECLGVPISFLDKHCPFQYTIIGATESEGKGFSAGLWNPESGIAQPMVKGERKYKRLFIKIVSGGGYNYLIYKRLIEEQMELQPEDVVYYSGVMGVPISFLDKYNPEQFEILGSNRGIDQDPSGIYGRSSYINNHEVFKRLFIRFVL